MRHSAQLRLSCLLVALVVGMGCEDAARSVASPANPGPRPPNPTPTPWITAVNPHEGFNDEPALAKADSGDIYVGWISFREGADSLVVSRYAHQGDRFSSQDRWTVLGGEGTYLLDLQAVPTQSGAFFTFAQEVDGDWDVFAVYVDADGPGAGRAYRRRTRDTDQAFRRLV